MTYTEDALIEQPAIKLFAELGWEVLNCWEENFGKESDLGRENRSDIVLTNRLRRALQKLNPAAPKLAIDASIEELTRDRSVMSAVAANEQLYLLLKEGYKYISNDEDEDDCVITIIDWRNPEHNDFLLCSQMSFTGEIETRRPDLLGFVNGLPLVFIELKASHRSLINAYRENLKDYRETIPSVFWFNQLILLSNGIQSKVGSITSQWEHFADWKKIESEKEARKVSLEVVLRGTCAKQRLLDIIENYIFYERKKQTVKIIAKYHQYLGVNEALRGLDHIKEQEGQLGVFWHTQGSGKSYSMVFFSQKAFRKLTGNWTFVIVTDRTDLDDQIYKTFDAAGVIKESRAQAESGEELKQLLSEDHRFVFTLIQKFRADKGEDYPVLSTRDDIIVITDEAHRSQYATLAMNMRRALPNAGFIAFTGTPLLADEEEKTKDVFGDYVSIYNFGDAVDDGATLPLYYENRVPEVSLNRDDLGEVIAEVLDQADLSDEQEARLEKEFARPYAIITDSDRLDTIAKDIVEHYMGRERFSSGVIGKAMVVSIDKATAIKMYNKVKHQWQLQLNSFKARAKVAIGSQKTLLQEKIQEMEATDMAVVVSGGQGDYERLQKMGLDFKPHRERIVKEKLDQKFKDEDDPLRIVFVCAMWMTGFDAPSVSTLYLDKPLKNHTLMQTIARANRVFPGKPAGQVVDYINIFGALQNALGLYGGAIKEPPAGYDTGSDIDSPADNKAVLLEELEKALNEVTEFLAKQNIDLHAIVNASTENLEKLNLLDEASETLLRPDLNEEFAAHVRKINRIFKAVLPDKQAWQYIKQRVAVCMIYRQMRLKSGLDVDDQDVLDVVRTQVNELIEDAIETVKIESNLPDPINIADIDFDALAEMLNRTKKPKRSDIERLRRIIEHRLSHMLERNATRHDLQQKFQELVEQYNLGAYQAEQFFNQLRDFVRQLDEEGKRAAKEGLNEAELAIVDLLCQGIQLSEKERNKVKTIAKELLEKLQEALVIDWRKKQRTKARIQKIIDDVFQELPEAYNDDLWPKACEHVYLHIFDKYAGEGRSVYAS